MTCKRPLILWLAVLVAAVTAAGSPLSAVVVYGDSLSDNGNLFAATGEPQPPYYQGRASNGELAVERLAAILGDPLLNYAWSGATTGIGNHLDPGGTATTVGTFGFPGMTTLYSSSVPAVAPLASTALFVISGGADDFLSPSPLDATPIAVADRAVSNITGIVSGLQSLGARRVLVMGLPDLGLTPYIRLMGPVASAQASALSDYFNARLRAALSPDVIFFDTAALLRSVVANPAGYGLTNVTDPCFDAAAPSPSVCSNPDQYVFWDELHPSARSHQILAEHLAQTVPEPSTFGLCSVVIACWLVKKKYQPRIKTRSSLVPPAKP